MLYCIQKRKRCRIVVDKQFLVINPRVYIRFADKVRSFYDAEAERLAQMNLRPAQARILHFIADFEGLSQLEVCRFFHLQPSTISDLLSGLEEDGYISRSANPQNKRMIRIHLTSKGKDATDRICGLFESFCDTCLGGFTAQEVATLEDLLLRFSDG